MTIAPIVEPPDATPASAPSRSRVVTVADDAARQRLIDAYPEAALVSATLPLRANLDVLENIAVVPRFRRNLDAETALQLAWYLLDAAGHADCAHVRDPDLTHEQRFVAKLLRAVIGDPPLILIDRPAMLLPDSPYPVVVRSVLARLESRLTQCWIVDYAWNVPLYPPPESRT